MNFENNKKVSDIYSDIINLPHHELTTRKRMPHSNRAASFSSFEALTGYDDEVEEVARLTDSRIELDDSEKLIINEKLQVVLKKTDLKPIIKVTYFIPDDKKSGGAYVNHVGTIKRVDEYERKIIFTDKKEIHIDDIYNIEVNPENHDNCPDF